MSTFSVLFFITLFFFLLMSISWFIFSYICIPRIDRRVEKAGKSRICPVNIWGLRTLDMAIGTALPVGNSLTIKGHPILSIEDVTPFSSQFDRVVSSVLLISFSACVLLAFVSSFFVPEKAWLYGQFNLSWRSVLWLYFSDITIIRFILPTYDA